MKMNEQQMGGFFSKLNPINVVKKVIAAPVTLITKPLTTIAPQLTPLVQRLTAPADKVINTVLTAPIKTITTPMNFVSPHLTPIVGAITGMITDQPAPSPGTYYDPGQPVPTAMIGNKIIYGGSNFTPPVNNPNPADNIYMADVNKLPSPVATPDSSPGVPAPVATPDPVAAPVSTGGLLPLLALGGSLLAIFK